MRLIALHRMRLHMGSLAEIAAGRACLRSEGPTRLFNEPPL
jgi:hypothetical protein